MQPECGGGERKGRSEEADQGIGDQEEFDAGVGHAAHCVSELWTAQVSLVVFID